MKKTRLSNKNVRLAKNGFFRTKRLQKLGLLIPNYELTKCRTERIM